LRASTQSLTEKQQGGQEYFIERERGLVA
jgi:hypothetical protein